MITCIAAMNKHGTIGLNGSMPWHAPEDLKHFKTYTMGKSLLMGRITYEGLPNQLKGRNIHVLTRNNNYPNGIQDVTSFLSTYDKIKEELVICGGGAVYRELLHRCDRLVLSYIKENDVIGDTFFPSFSLNDFRIIEIRAFKTFDLYIYERKIG